MADNLPSFPFYPNDWLGSLDVTMMTLAEEGAFARLLAYAWADPDCGLPDDETRIRALLKNTPDIALALPEQCHRFALENVLKKFEKENGKLVSRKLQKLKKEYLEHRELRVKAGRKGGKSLWDKKKNRSGNAKAKPKQSQGDAKALLKPSLALAPSLASSSSSSPALELSSEESLSGKPDFEAIIEDLNRKTGKNFRHTPKKVRESITARWNEGFRLPDFQRVHDNMTAKWKNDPKMNQYLRPDTLYSPKFDSYLNTTVGLSDRGVCSAKTERGMAALQEFVKEGENAVS